MYSGEAFQEQPHSSGNSVAESNSAGADRSTASFLGKDQPWAQLATSAMTSMVVSLDCIQLVKELLVAPTYDWDLQNYAALLSALETSHWHAFCFNENSPLRLQLQQRGFMNKNRSARNISAELPHLLEQEVLSMEQMLFTVFRLYCHNQPAPAPAPIASPAASGSSKKGTAVSPRAESPAAVFAEPWVER